MHVCGSGVSLYSISTMVYQVVNGIGKENNYKQHQMVFIY
jgi:hypothetical protein